MAAKILFARGANCRHTGSNMRSMTGYGRGECAQDGFKITAELSSVNRRQSELVVYLPRELEPLESRVRDDINQQVARGRLTVRVILHATDRKYDGRLRLNVALAKGYARELALLAKELKLAETVTLDMLLRTPGVVQTEEAVADAEDFWPATRKALRLAIEMLVKMREREGDHLAKDLCGRMATMRKAVTRIEKHAPRVTQHHRQQLLARIHRAGLESVTLDDPRLLQEIVFFADRSDISEELTRLRSHFHQFDDCARSQEPVGRTLDFLAQEMNREVNTIGSKANSALISPAVVTLKAELEKFREQVQNIE